MQPLLVFGSWEVWGIVTSGTGGKSPSTFAAAFCNKVTNNQNPCAMKSHLTNSHMEPCMVLLHIQVDNEMVKTSNHSNIKVLFSTYIQYFSYYLLKTMQQKQF
jgi:hypothetical protein